MKKILSYVMALIFIMGMLPINIAPAYAEEDIIDDNMAIATLGNGLLKSKSFNTVSQGKTDGEPVYTYVVAAGRTGWELSNKNPYIYIDVDDEFAHEVTDGTSFELEIDYYDALKGFFQFEYDGIKTEKKYGGYTFVDSANEWKTASFTLDDAYFGGRCHDYDIRIDATAIGGRNRETKYTQSPVTIGEIRLKKYEKKNPIKVEVSIDEAGNCFEWYKDEKKIVNTFTNLRDTEITADVTFWGISSENVKCFEKTEKLTIGGGETKSITVNADSKRCDLYDYYVQIKSEKDGVNSLLNPTKFAILKTDENGYKNSDVYICCHPDFNHSEQEIIEMLEVIGKSNTGGIRSSVTNGYTADRAGNDLTAETFIGPTVRELKKNNLKWMPIIHGPNIEGISYDEAPHTPESWAKFKIDAEALIKASWEVCDWYEIFNETNHTFSWEKNERLGDVINYGEMVRVTREIADKYDTDIKLMGYGMCDMGRPTQQDFFDRALEGGAWDYLDAFSSHPYSTAPTEVGGAETLAFKWYDYVKEKSGNENLDYVPSELGFTTADTVTEGDHRLHGDLQVRYDIYYKSIGLSDLSFIYNFARKGTVDYLREDSFGLTEVPWYHLSQEQKICIPYEGYVVFAGHNYIFADTDMKEKIADSDNLYINKFYSNKFNEDILTLNTTERKYKRVVTVDLGTDKVEVYDDYGNMTEQVGHDGKFTFWVDERPIYVKGKFEKTELLEDNTAFLDVSENYIIGAQNDIVGVNFTNYTDKTYDVEVVLPEDIGHYSGDKIAPGTSEVIFTLNGEEGTQSLAEIRLKDGGKIVHNVQVYITVDKSVTSEVSFSLISPDNVDLWEMDLRLTNTSKLNVARGTIEFNSPEEFKKLGKIDIGNIPKDKTSKYKIKLPKLIKKGIYNIDFDLNLEDGTTYNYIQQEDMTVAKYAEVKPVIDGVIEPEAWKYNTWMYADKAEQLKNNVGWTGPEDKSVRATVMWDEENLYFGAVVTDNIFYQPYSGLLTWKADNIQMGIFYGEEAYTISGQRATTFHELSMAHTSKGDEVYRTLSQDSYYAPGFMENAEIRIVPNGNTTVYEARIPWEGYLLPGQKPEAGRLMGFSYMANESDGGDRNGWIEYASGIGLHKDTTLFTWLTLLK